MHFLSLFVAATLVFKSPEARFKESSTCVFFLKKKCSCTFFKKLKQYLNELKTMEGPHLPYSPTQRNKIQIIVFFANYFFLRMYSKLKGVPV